MLYNENTIDVLRWSSLVKAWDKLIGVYHFLLVTWNSLCVIVNELMEGDDSASSAHHVKKLKLYL